ncbi:endonuclease Q family protein [Ureibacillus sp. FSL W8-0352]|uniref:endonuclease Q family protein n=1 Tax=Ureibacillus sp. FSL W8-0352 TaxID=2954596 RepID=UPI0030FC7909
MKNYYVDLHIHIGRTESGRAVKITGSKNLTLKNILQTASSQKGLDIVGIIDCHSPEVIKEIEQLVEEQRIELLPEGGLRFDKTTLIPGSEIEIFDEHCKGPIHVLSFFPTLEYMKKFSEWMRPLLKNIHLSSQRIYCDGRTLQQKVQELEGLFIPAHVFTPFKSLYGKGVEKSLSEVFDPERIDAIELGLSSDTYMVQGISELEKYPFVTNSDAHSLGKLAREYQKVQLEDANFKELVYALQEKGGRKILANYGLNPLLGKYHSTVCQECGEHVESEESCSACGSSHLVKGVSKRINELKDHKPPTRHRPPYIHQVPLDFIPGVGAKTIRRLIEAFGTEMAILHEVSVEQLEQVVPKKIANLIDLARRGKLNIEVGGGGMYGKVIE